MRLALLGNCQVDVYRRLLEASAPSTLHVQAIEVWRYKAAEYDALGREALKADVIVTQALSEAYGALATSRLQSHTREVLRIQNIYFQGYHPDCAYVGPMGARLKSPVGDYHSQWVYDAWRRGATVADAVRGLRHYDPNKVLSVFASSTSELQTRELSVDVPASDLLLDTSVGYRRLFTFNHPTIELHRLYLERILQRAGLAFVLSSSCIDPLMQHTRWPLYPAVCEALNIDSSNARLDFVPSASLGVDTLDVQRFCERSFERYDQSSNSSPVVEAASRKAL